MQKRQSTNATTPGRLEQPDPPDRDGRIQPAWRVLSAGAAIACLGAGGYAVFDTKLEAGPVALLGVGLVFALIAMGGVLPTYLKIGQLEWQLREAQRRNSILTNAMREIPASPAQAEAIAKQISDTAPDLAIDLQAYAGYALHVSQLLETLATELGFVYNGQISLPDRKYDGVITARDNPRPLIFVEIRPQEITRRWVRSVLLTHVARDEEVYGKPTLVVSRQTPFPEATQDVGDYANIYWFTYNGQPGQRDRLKNMILQLTARGAAAE